MTPTPEDQKAQSKYTKENLYDLDSDDDELDFLKIAHGVNIEKRNEMRTEKKAKIKKDLFQNYDRKYPVVKFEEDANTNALDRGISNATYGLPPESTFDERKPYIPNQYKLDKKKLKEIN